MQVSSPYDYGIDFKLIPVYKEKPPIVEPPLPLPGPKFKIIPTCTNGIITPHGIQSVESGNDITFKIIPNVDYMLVQLLVDGIVTTPTTILPEITYTFVNVIKNHTIEAICIEIPVDKHTIISTNEPGGTISPLGDIFVTEGSNITFTITPDEFYEVDQIVIDGIVTPPTTTSPTITYVFNNVLEDHTIYVDFKPLTTYTVTSSVIGGNGNIIPLGTTTIVEGKDITFTVTPNVGYEIDQFKIDGVLTSIS